MKNKIIALFLGLIFIVLILETLLRINFHFLQSHNNSSLITSDQFNILCIGNSHTVGSGVEPDQAYPAVLESILKEKFKNKKIKVYNRGMVGANTSMIIDALPGMIREVKPQLVIVLAGEPNSWTWYGFSRFISINKRLKFLNKNNSLSFMFFSLLRQLRTVRLIEIFSRNTLFHRTFEDLNPLERIMLWRSSLDGAALSLSREEAVALKGDLEQFIALRKFKDIPNERDFLISLSMLYRTKFNNVTKVIELINESINLDSHFDFLADLEIKEILEDKSFTASLPQLNHLKSILKTNRSRLLNKKDYETAFSLFHYTDLANLNEKVYKSALNIVPTSAYIQKNYYFKFIKYSSSSNAEKIYYLTSALETLGPFTSESRPLFLELDKLSNLSNEDEKVIAQFKTTYNSKYPHFEESNKLLTRETLKDWISFDIGQMIRQLEGEKVRVLLLNYHWLRGNFLENDINSAILFAAQETQTPFSDVNTFFKHAVKNGNLPEEKYFAQKFGATDNHPSPLGHQIIAKKIALDLEKYHLIF